jgi:hypothetical protein
VDTAIVAGAFALGGVVLGGAMNWAAGRGVARREVAGQRDEAMAALADVCVRLQAEARTWRDLHTPKSKLQQLLFGVMESEARRPVALAPNAAAALTQLAVGSVAYGMRNAHPVAQAEGLCRQVMPLLSEVTVLSMRLSMSGDEGIKAACVRVSTAAVALIENITERPHDYARREAEVEASAGQLRRARDAAAAPWWWRRKMRQAVSP